MTLKLPAVIDAFVQAKNKHDSNAVLACFADNAVVYDEGQKIQGLTEIKKWIDAANAKYKVNLDITNIVNIGQQTILTALVSGNFEGRPVPLNYHLSIHEGKITKLKILLSRNIGA